MPKALDELLIGVSKAKKHSYITNQIWFELFFNIFDSFILHVHSINKNYVAEKTHFVSVQTSFFEFSLDVIFYKLAQHSIQYIDITLTRVFNIDLNIIKIYYDKRF